MTYAEWKMTMKEVESESEAIKEEREKQEREAFLNIMYDYDIENLIHEKNSRNFNFMLDKQTLT